MRMTSTIPTPEAYFVTFNLLMNCSLRRIVLLISLSVLSSCTSLSSSTERPIFADENGALRGYDPVAYFTEVAAVAGDRRIRYRFAGHDFYFASEDNRQRFIDNPDAYLPQYGGYCAYGMSKGFVVSTAPEAFSLMGGKLYLNYSLRVRKTWLKDVPGHISNADRNWAQKLSSNEAIAE